jgi:hypothetical protein
MEDLISWFTIPKILKIFVKTLKKSRKSVQHIGFRLNFFIALKKGGSIRSPLAFFSVYAMTGQSNDLPAMFNFLRKKNQAFDIQQKI